MSPTPYRQPVIVLSAPTGSRARALVRDADDDELAVPPVAIRAPEPDREPTWVEMRLPMLVVVLAAVVASVILLASTR